MKKGFFKGMFSALLACALLLVGCGDKECAHMAGDWIVDKAPDCETAGSKHAECKICGETVETASLDATGHSFENGVCGVCTYVCAHENVEWTVDTQAACVADGEKHSVCTLCGETVEAQGIEATGHTFENGACKTCNADVWDGTVDVSWYIAETSEYTVTTAEQFAGLAKLAAGGNTLAGVTVTLGVDLYFDSLEWTPIGTATTAFAGTLDGGGHILSDLSINDYAGQCAGIFGYLTGIVKDLHVKTLQVQTATSSNGTFYVGGIAGRNEGTIENCGVSGAISVISLSDCYIGGAIGYNAGAVKNVIADCDVETAYINESYASASQLGYKRYVGGLMGHSDSATVENCVASGDVRVAEKRATSTNSEILVYAGGFIGYNNGATIRDSSASGAIVVGMLDESYISSSGNQKAYVGGFIGELYYGGLENNSATGNVTVNKWDKVYAGGFVGLCISANNVSSKTTTVINCYATGNVNAPKTVGTICGAGGFGGQNSGTYITLEKCYSTGDVGGDAQGGACYMGGFIGLNGGDISECYATGNVESLGYFRNYSGGLIGSNDGELTRCYATGDVKATAYNDYAYCSTAGGGLVGFTSGKATNCYATGDVSATAYVTDDYNAYAYAGGLVGYASGYDCVITQCYTTGEVTKKTYLDGDTAGAYSKGRGYGASFVGYTDYATIAKSYGTGNVIDAGGGGAIKYFAYKYGTPSISNCYHLDGITLTKLRDGESTLLTSSDTTSVATASDTLLTVEFHSNTLGWNAKDWVFADGAYPTLVCFAA